MEIFSWYLTILDYKDPKTLSKFTLPKLKGINLVVSDFFDEEKLSDLKNIEFEFIIDIYVKKDYSFYELQFIKRK